MTYYNMDDPCVTLNPERSSQDDPNSQHQASQKPPKPKSRV